MAFMTDFRAQSCPCDERLRLDGFRTALLQGGKTKKGPANISQGPSFCFDSVGRRTRRCSHCWSLWLTSP